MAPPRIRLHYLKTYICNILRYLSDDYVWSIMCDLLFVTRYALQITLATGKLNDRTITSNTREQQRSIDRSWHKYRPAGSNLWIIETFRIAVIALAIRRVARYITQYWHIECFASSIKCHRVIPLCENWFLSYTRRVLYVLSVFIKLRNCGILTCSVQT